MLESIKNAFKKFAQPEVNKNYCVEKAIRWVKMYNVNRAAATVPHRNKNVLSLTQETGGYMIATMYNVGEKQFAYKLARWAASRQRSDGAFSAIDNAPYTFDTAQVVRGFLAVLDDMPEIEDNLRRACEYVESKIAPNGEVLHDTYETWKFEDGSMLSEYGNLYVLPPLLRAGEKLRVKKYIVSARRGMDYYRQKPDLVEFKPSMTMLSHYLGYMMEALVELGENDLAKKGLSQASAIQKGNGAIPAYPGVDWVCSTGLAQLSIAWYMLGMREPADKAMSYLEKLQNSSGGFYGSYGEGSQYFPEQEISWAVKFFLDADRLRGKH
jgi:malonyl-CoA O-methyltransferase